MGRTSDARRRLIDAAHELIWEYSFGAVTIDAICERAGVKKGSFYYFFSSKSDLALVAVNAWWEQRCALFEQVFHADTPPLERIRRYLDFVVERQLQMYEKTGQVLGCPLFTLGSEISLQDEKLRARVHEILKTGTVYFEKAIVEAQALGEIDGRSATMKARMLVSYYEGVLTQARIENDPEPIRALSSNALDLIGARVVLAAA